MKYQIICALATLAISGPVQPSGAPQAQTITPGDAHVQSHLPVALVADPVLQRQAAASLGALSRGSVSVPPEEAVTGVHVEVVWRPGTREERVLPLGSGAVLLPVTPHRSESYAYFLRLRDSRGRFEARLPAAPGLYRIEAEAAKGPTVLDGTGDGQAAQGERIPIQVRIADPTRVREVVLFHRSAPATPWTSALMEVRNQSDDHGIWTASVQRPLGRETELEYYVRATGSDDRVTHYGLADRPHRLTVTAPSLPADADQ